MDSYLTSTIIILIYGLCEQSSERYVGEETNLVAVMINPFYG